MSGWTDNDIGILWNQVGLASGGYPNIDASDDDQMVTLQGVGGALTVLTQDIQTVIGEQYTLTFEHSILCANSTSTVPLDLQVGATGNISQVYTMTPVATTDAGGTWLTLPYVTQTYAFTATSEITTITIENMTYYSGEFGATENFGTTIDNVVLVDPLDSVPTVDAGADQYLETTGTGMVLSLNATVTDDGTPTITQKASKRLLRLNIANKLLHN